VFGGEDEMVVETGEGMGQGNSFSNGGECMRARRKGREKSWIQMVRLGTNM
jgi:hypothetical protein